MVTPAVRHAPAARTPSPCPRCGTRLRWQYDELTCLSCGYADYQARPPEREKPSGLSRLACRYLGMSVVAHDIVWYRYGGPQGRTVIPSCPFCGRDMATKRELRRGAISYSCALKHQMSMVIGANGVEGWR